MQLNRAVIVFLGSTATLAALAACSGDDDETVEPLPTPAVVQDTSTAQPTREVQAQPAPPQLLDAIASIAEEGTIDIQAAGLLFAPNNWTIPVGESATIRVTNADPQPHNLRLAGPDGEYETMDDAITVPDTVNAGETGELTFAPLVPGDYTFRCDFHPTTMGGQIAVDLGLP